MTQIAFKHKNKHNLVCSSSTTLTDTLGKKSYQLGLGNLLLDVEVTDLLDYGMQAQAVVKVVVGASCT